MDERKRWIPRADRWAAEDCHRNAVAEAVMRPPLFAFNEIHLIFVWRHCPDWPVRLVQQH